MGSSSCFYSTQVNPFSLCFLCVMGFTICLVTEKMRELEGKLNVEMGFGFWCFCDEKFAFLGFVGI